MPLSGFETALGLVFDPYVLLVILLAALFGLFVGALPGLTATMATALLVPITFFMDPVPAIGAIVAAVAMAIFAGDISGTLLRIPGTPASAAYVEDAHRMTRKGQAELALGLCLVTSAIGGLFGSAVLAFSAPSLAEVALQFSSFEYFWLACFGLSCAVFISTDAPVKGVVSLLIGLFIATIGIDIIAGHPRFSFGNVELMGGVSFIPAMIGMFAIGEILRFATTTGPKLEVASQAIVHIFRGLGRTLWRYKVNLFRGNLIGVAIGILPGAGADIAAWISYAVAKRFSKEPEKFGTGHPEGLVDAGAANNSALGGAWVPALVFGIPGDSVTAIVIGVLYMKNVNPGPTVLLHAPELLYSVFIVFFLANLLMLPLGYAAIRLSRQILRVPRDTLMPIILIFCIVGAFAINNTVFGVGIILVLGVVAYVMEENGFPIAPAILGIVLGPLVEENFMTSMIKSNGNLIGFFERPIAAGLGVVTLLIWAWVIIAWAVRAARAGGPADAGEERAV
ncbi:MAG TPA: tripartite tricarboxylate transporter permease [Geminicoccaceae bacterium]